MANRFKRVDRAQQFLLPPDMKAWLPADHPVWLLISTVERLNFKAFEARYRLGGRGREAFSPAMMVTLLVWCMAGGERSSRRIELACQENIAARVICGGHMPDHTTISKFLVLHESDFKDLFEQILELCQRAGLLQLGVIALDGTKIAANASKGSNRKVSRLREEVEEAVAKTKAQDEADDERFGDSDGHQVPLPFADPDLREANLDDLVDAMPGSDSEEADNAMLGTEGTGGGDTMHGGTDLVPVPATDPVPVPGTDPVRPVGHGLVPFSKGGTCRDLDRLAPLLAVIDGRAGGTADPATRVNVVDPDSRLMSAATGGTLQGFNCQVVAAKGQVVIAVQATNRCNDYGLLGPMTDLTLGKLAAAGITSRPATMLADAGYSSDADLCTVTAHPDMKVLVALGKTRTVGADPGPDPIALWENAKARIDADVAAEQQRRARIFQSAAASGTPICELTTVIGLSQAATNASYNHWRAGGADNIKVKPAKNPYKTPTEASRRRRDMAVALAEPANKELYKQRSAIIEGVHAHTKTILGITRFRRRGLPAVQAELELSGTTVNTFKLIRSIANLARITARTT